VSFSWSVLKNSYEILDLQFKHIIIPIKKEQYLNGLAKHQLSFMESNTDSSSTSSPASQSNLPVLCSIHSNFDTGICCWGCTGCELKSIDAAPLEHDGWVMLPYGLCGSIFCTKITGTSGLTIVQMGWCFNTRCQVSGWGGMCLYISLRSAHSTCESHVVFPAFCYYISQKLQRDSAFPSCLDAPTVAACHRGNN
jgi:hypothetical protein